MPDFNLSYRGKQSKSLRTFVEVCYEKLRTIPEYFSQYPLIIILSLWDETSEYNNNKYDDQRNEIIISGVDGKNLRLEFIDRLSNILNEDPHLNICCGGLTINLATAIDLLYLGNLIKGEYYLKTRFNDDQKNKLYQDLENKLYESEYKRIALFHLFNFEKDKDFELNFETCSIIYLSQQFIPAILGEYTPMSRLHTPGIGNFFIVLMDSEAPSDSYEWIYSKYWSEAREILGLLQYFKDGIVDIDYYTFYFQPNWVNTIWRMGNFYFGEIRREKIDTKYRVIKEEIPMLKNYWKIYKDNFEKLNILDKSPLGKSIQRAVRHYSNYNAKNKKEEQFIDLIIALESLFSPGSQEVTFRLCQYAGAFLGSENDGYEINEFIKEMLNLRGSIFHGKYDIRKVEEDKLISNENLAKFASYVRKAILGFIILYLRGEIHKIDEMHDILLKSLFDPEMGAQIRKKADPVIFIEEKFTS